MNNKKFPKARGVEDYIDFGKSQYTDEQLGKMAVTWDPSKPTETVLQWGGRGPAPKGTVTPEDYLKSLKRKKVVETTCSKVYWYTRLWNKIYKFFKRKNRGNYKR